MLWCYGDGGGGVIVVGGGVAAAVDVVEICGNVAATAEAAATAVLCKKKWILITWCTTLQVQERERENVYVCVLFFPVAVPLSSPFFAL